MWPPPATEVPVSRRGKFPGLQQPDANVLRDALTRGLIQPERMWLNVPVGDLPPWSEQPDLAPFAYRLRTIYQRRVDLVALTGQDLAITEIKPLASPTAIGQALLYLELVKRRSDVLGEPHAAILCQALQPDVGPLIRKLGIRCTQTSPLPPPSPTPPEPAASNSQLARPSPLTPSLGSLSE